MLKRQPSTRFFWVCTICSAVRDVVPTWVWLATTFPPGDGDDRSIMLSGGFQLSNLLASSTIERPPEDDKRGEQFFLLLAYGRLPAAMYHFSRTARWIYLVVSTKLLSDSYYIKQATGAYEVRSRPSRWILPNNDAGSVYTTDLQVCFPDNAHWLVETV